MKEHKEVSALLQQAKQERRCCYGTSDAQRRALKRRLHAGELVSPYKNLYADRTLWNTMTREQQSLQVIRALSAIHPQWVFAGLSAACVYGLQHNYSLHDGTVHIASKSGIGGGDEARLNRMELTGLLEALRQLKEPCDIDLYSDSQYVINGLEKGWAKGWRKRGWKKADKSPALNPDLWAPLLEESEKHVIHYHWLKGHAGHPENERCDRLAVEQSKKYGGKQA